MTDEVNPFELPYVSLSFRQGLPSIPAVYFVIQNNSEILYIGQSENLKNRWKNHGKLAEIRKLGGDSRIAWLKADKASLAELEAEFIGFYKPSLNIAVYTPWKLGKTCTIRVPISFADGLVKVARAIDSGKITFEDIYKRYPQLRKIDSEIV